MVHLGLRSVMCFSREATMVIDLSTYLALVTTRFRCSARDEGR